jgi:hypothetical protein
MSALCFGQTSARLVVQAKLIVADFRSRSVSQQVHVMSVVISGPATAACVPRINNSMEREGKIVQIKFYIYGLGIVTQRVHQRAK